LADSCEAPRRRSSGVVPPLHLRRRGDRIAISFAAMRMSPFGCRHKADISRLLAHVRFEGGYSGQWLRDDAMTAAGCSLGGRHSSIGESSGGSQWTR
jgi:hypothetical protein